MNGALSLGPLLLPLPLLVVFASVGSALALGHWLGKAAPQAVERILWRSLLLGFVVARLAFVAEFAASYAPSPWTVLDIRDGGWNAAWGLAAGWLAALFQLRRAAPLRKPVLGALGLGSAVFALATVLQSLPTEDKPQLPTLALRSLDGQSVDLADFAGRPTVVNLWATWCPPCVREMPVLQAAQQARPDVHIVSLNQGEDPAHVAQWLARRGLALRHVLLDPDGLAGQAFQQKGYPTTLFFNAQGELVSTRVGELSAATLAERLQQLKP